MVGPNNELIPTTMTSSPTCTQWKGLLVAASSAPTSNNCFKCQYAPTASANAPTGKVTIGNTKRTYRVIADDGNKYIGYRPTSVSAQLYNTNVLIMTFVSDGEVNPAGNTISRHDMRIRCNITPNTKFPFS
mmetsp:Transcript_20420/g.30633  ORF Transcript_20420/g.30633 Transcript_20420/m.30633 type:complete len:131 (-) Transcript_20420:461-853(-)